jgi:hypothetical protein
LEPKLLKKNNLVAPRAFACHRHGEIVTAKVFNPIENEGRTKGKARPAILIKREGARWLVMGLTTLPHFANGAPRTPVPNPTACGLGARVSYLWGRATWICAMDVGDHIGHADDDLLALITCSDTDNPCTERYSSSRAWHGRASSIQQTISSTPVSQPRKPTLAESATATSRLAMAA